MREIVIEKVLNLICVHLLTAGTPYNTNAGYTSGRPSLYLKSELYGCNLFSEVEQLSTVSDADVEKWVGSLPDAGLVDLLIDLVMQGAM